MTEFLQLAVYLVPMVLVWLIYLVVQNSRSRLAASKRQQAVVSGLSEPASLHPQIDPSLCMGCGACVNACPEGKILGLIQGKAQLLEPANCIGHGACQAACPFSAITLVFGTARRGVDIPRLNPDFETTVNGVFIAGELGGMGLIRNAMTQGVQSVEAIARKLKTSSAHLADDSADLLDLLIVGSGPAGIAASLTASSLKLRTVAIEQNQLGGTVSHYPRNKIVMTTPVTLPIAGKIKLRETSKESLLALWQKIIAEHALPIRFAERLQNIDGEFGNFDIHTTRGRYRAKTILLCLGRRGTPRTLGIPGENLPKVVYSMTDPRQYRHQRVLVVGGGDSALEAAIGIAEEEGARVVLSYRGEAVSRAKQKNRMRVEQLVAQGDIEVMLSSEVLQIQDRYVHLSCGDTTIAIENDAVIVCAGGLLPTPFLKSLGIQVETKYGTV